MGMMACQVMELRSYIYGGGKLISTSKHTCASHALSDVCTTIKVFMAGSVPDVWADIWIISADKSRVFFRTIDPAEPKTLAGLTATQLTLLEVPQTAAKRYDRGAWIRLLNKTAR